MWLQHYAPFKFPKCTQWNRWLGIVEKLQLILWWHQPGPSTQTNPTEKNRPLLQINTVVPPHHSSRIHLSLTREWECFMEEKNSAEHEIVELWILMHEAVFSKTLDWSQQYYQYSLWGNNNLILSFENPRLCLISLFTAKFILMNLQESFSSQDLGVISSFREEVTTKIKYKKQSVFSPCDKPSLKW